MLHVVDATAEGGVLIDNTATDGNPILAFGLSGTKTFTMGIDDGDSDKFKIFSGAAIDGTSEFVIDGSGNVGIGQAPFATHDAYATLRLGGNGQLLTQKAVQVNSLVIISNNAQYDTDGSWEYVSTDEATQLIFRHGGYEFGTAPSGTAGNDITFTNRFVIAEAGDVTVNTGNLVIGTAGKGIDFSAQTATTASNTSVDAELLDHYEEGRFTAVLEDGAGNAATTVNIPSTLNASYVRIGSVVHINGFLNISSVSAFASGNCKITGLPFVIGTGSAGWAYSYLSGGFGFGYASGLSLSAVGGVFGTTENNTSYIGLYVSDSTSAYTPLAYDEIGGSSQLIWSTTYTTATA
jgi:hypothetical protein